MMKKWSNTNLFLSFQVPNSAIKSCTIQTKLDGKDFFGGPKQDYSLKAVEDRSRLEKAQ